MSDDASVMEMASIGSKMRDVVVYIVNKDDDLVMEVSKKLASLFRGKIEGEKKKLTPRRAQKEKGKSGPSNNPDHTIEHTPSLTSEKHNPYITSQNQNLSKWALEEGEDREDEENDDHSKGDDSEDESYNVSSELDDSESESYIVSEEEFVSENEVDGQALNTVRNNKVVDPLSDYEGSKGELGQVTKHTEFKKFKWFVGLSFPNPLAFRDALKNYALV
ncbi:uncharacterized protein LOC130801653 [Amaranthus tricolor]|uniref:uncharacterized protein LOC130801653 n=1 Tax=Amaranthus tricolor TaxID=29722 RepID=UPI00258FCC43|nr:uncharacterized protein LOC130801653 [Amaranthus tricolor]XP_057521518.1 uncharacterized protein LOC130801653 [Amaranthus tricolor]